MKRLWWDDEAVCDYMEVTTKLLFSGESFTTDDNSHLRWSSSSISLRRGSRELHRGEVQWCEV